MGEKCVEVMGVLSHIRKRKKEIPVHLIPNHPPPTTTRSFQRKTQPVNTHGSCTTSALQGKTMATSFAASLKQKTKEKKNSKMGKKKKTLEEAPTT